MSNPMKGEVDLVVGPVTYTLKMSINSIIQMEDLLNRGSMEIAAIMADKTDIRVGVWRAALWAALRTHHPEVTLEGAADIIGEAKIVKVMSAVSTAMQTAFPKPSTVDKDKTPNPRKASRRGTGKRSKSNT